MAAPTGVGDKRRRDTPTEGGGGDAPPPKQRAAPKCTHCRQPRSICAGGKKCAHLDCAKPSPPKEDLYVMPGNDGLIGVVDIEHSDRKKLNELGCVETFFQADSGGGGGGGGEAAAQGEWLLTQSEFKAVTNEPLNRITANLCPNLQAEARMSTQTTKEALVEFCAHVEARGIKYIAGHGAVTVDVAIPAEVADELGLDFIAMLEKAGVIGIIDTLRIINAHNLQPLKRAKAGGGAGTALGNADLYSKATDGKKMKDYGLQEHRALDDAKAERTWMTVLPEIKDVLYGPQKQQCAVSIASFRAYHVQYQKHRALLKSLPTTD